MSIEKLKFSNMIQYNVICLRDGIVCYKKIHFLTDEELAKHLSQWSVYTLKNLLERWNQQRESLITKLKWIYYE